MDTATKTAIDTLKTAAKKVICKAAKATGEFIGKKIAEKTLKPKPLPAGNSRNAEKIIKRFNCIKICDKKMDWSEWFIR